MSIKHAERDFKKNPLKRSDTQIHFVDEHGEKHKTSTKQADRERCDVNYIMHKYTKTGQITHLRDNQGRYMNAVDVGDFRENMTKVALAKQSFEALPAALRKKFDNDPAVLLDFLSRDENRDEGVKLGLIQPPEPVDATPLPQGDNKAAPAAPDA